MFSLPPVPRPTILACFVLLLSVTFATPNGLAQSQGLIEKTSALPNVPEASQSPEQAGTNRIQLPGTGNISGTILDPNGGVLQNATVTLNGPGITRTETSGSDGQFQFPNLPPGTYKVTASAEGMGSRTSDPIQLKSGEFHIASALSLAVSGVISSITVNGNKEELAEQQVRIAEQQRVVGVIPNFYSAYDWNAPPMMGKQKFKLTSRALIDPVSFLAVAGIAGAEQYKGIFPAYGSGIEGYGKRYGAALANRVSGEMLGRAVYPSIFHQDPRYFYKGKGSIKSRALYAMSRAVITRNDDGRLQPNYSQVLGNFSASALSNLYYPAADRGGSLVLLNGLADMGANAVSNLFREFVLKQITSHVPADAKGQP